MIQCGDCQKVFTQKSNLYRHKKQSCKYRLSRNIKKGQESIKKLILLRCKTCNIWYVKNGRENS